MQPEYANWISKKIPLTAGIVTILLGAGSIAAFNKADCPLWFRIVLLLFTLVFCLYTVYIIAARHVLSYHGKGVQGKVLDRVLSYLSALSWGGTGKLLDIGCGSGAMSIKAAKKFPLAKITGIDYWGAGWDYSKRLCETNACAENVSSRVSFLQGDAAKLPFADNSFDAAVSNFVFHEVRSQPDKQALIREALRVIKPDGCFVFEDVFFSKRIYGNIDQFVQSLTPYVQEIHFVDTRNPNFAPKFLNTPLVLGPMGLIYGRK